MTKKEQKEEQNNKENNRATELNTEKDKASQANTPVEGVPFSQGEQIMTGNKGGNNNQYLIPLSIVVAGMFVAAAVYFSGGGAGPQNAQLAGTNNQAPTEQQAGNAPTDVTVEEVTEEDHIRGSLDAPVKIVEFSDFECPFCQRIHPNLKRIVDEYDGQVAWVYRHFPLDSIHPQATPAAHASECVAQIMGNDAFWEFADTLFNNQSALSEAFYTSTVSDMGISTSIFNACQNSGRYTEKIQNHTQQAQDAGGRGTPYSIVIAPNGKTFPVNGAQPYSSIKATIDLALQEK